MLVEFEKFEQADNDIKSLISTLIQDLLPQLALFDS